METSLYKVAHALYIISDRIKILRKKKIIWEDVILFSRKNTKKISYKKMICRVNIEVEKLYDLKNSVLNIFRSKYNIQPVGFHVDIDGKKRDMYKIFSYKFHSDNCISSNYLGEIDTVTFFCDNSLRVDKLPTKDQVINDVYLTKEHLINIRKMSLSDAFKILRIFADRKDISIK